MDMTPQQFGSLVGDQMGKDAGAVAPKSLPVEALKLMGKAVYHTPRSLKTLAAGGAGGYALGHNAGEASGMEQGQADAAKNLAERLLGTPAANMKQAFLGAAGRAIGGAVSGAINAAKPMVTNAVNAVGDAAMKYPTTAAAVAAGAGTAAAIPALKHLENQRIDAQIDRQRARAMAQQPKPQMATGMPQAPAPAPAAAPAPQSPAQQSPAAPMMAKQAVPSGPGGGLYMGDPNQRTQAQPSAAADMRRLGPGGAIAQQNAIRQQMMNSQRAHINSNPGQGLNPAQQKAMLGGGGIGQQMRQVPNAGQPMPKMPSNGVLPASTGQGGIMGGGGPLSMSLAGKQAGLVPSFQQAAREGLSGMRKRFQTLENMRGISERLLSGDHYPMPSVADHVNIVNRGSIRAADIGSQLQRMLKQMRVPADQIKDTVGNAPIAWKPNDSRIGLAGKQAGAINELLSEFGGRAAQGLKTQGAALAGKVGPALEQAKNVASDLSAKARSGLQTYGKRLTGDSTLKPLYQRADMINDMGDDLLRNIPNPDNVAVNAMRYNPNPVGNPTQAVMDARRMRNTGNAAHTQLLRHQNDAQKAIARERGAIDLTRNLTTGAGAAGTIGAIGLMARHNNKQANSPAPAASLATSLAPYTAWGRGYNFGTDTSNHHYQDAMARGAMMGGLTGLSMEAMREKTEEEKKQSILRKFMRYVAHAGAGAAGGAGAGGLVGAVTAPGKLRMHDSLAAKLPADFNNGKLEAKGLMALGPVGEGKAAAEKEAARGDMVNKLLSYLKNRTLLQAEVVQPAGKAITGGWQTTSGVLGAPGGINHHFAPSTVRETTTPPVLVRDLMQKAKDLMPLSGGMPERGGGYFDNNQKDLAGVVKQLYQAKKTGVR